jgi:hypothetical protein
LRTYAHQIADSRKHSLRKRSEDAGDALDGPAFDDGSEFDKVSDHLDQPEQLSLFTALSATVADGPHPIAGVFDDQFDEDERESELIDGDPGYGSDGADGLMLDVTTLVPPLPKQPANVGLSVPGFASMNRYEQKEALRVRNAELARDIARAAAMEHRVVNSQLNKAVGITRIGEATVEQLDRRAREAQRWYSRL